jgi:hypothetical protein
MKSLELILTELQKFHQFTKIKIEVGEDGLFTDFDYDGKEHRIIASWGMGWEHVSVSLPGQNRCPTWNEMCNVKNLFWNDNETVIQYHPAKQDYVNCHPFVLHLWKPIGIELPKPPTIMIGPK